MHYLSAEVHQWMLDASNLAILLRTGNIPHDDAVAAVVSLMDRIERIIVEMGTAMNKVKELWKAAFPDAPMPGLQ